MNVFRVLQSLHSIAQKKTTFYEMPVTPQRKITESINDNKNKKIELCQHHLIELLRHPHPHNELGLPYESTTTSGVRWGEPSDK
tara:strand:- start:1065 stop:1316 length:252 start_codon:yes stop_codon:yes gene_type:complete